MKILANFFMITTILFMGTFHIAVHSQNVEYGHTCKMLLKCISSNMNDPLECTSNDQREGRCMCPGDMFRHEELNRCVSPHLKTCTLQSGEGLPIRTCTKFAQCWPAKKGSLTNVNRVDGICYCDGDAKFDNYTSECKLKFGSNRCEKETDCDVRSLITCRDGHCVCQNEADQIYNGAEKKCSVLAEGSCRTEPPFLTPECGVNMDCIGTCKCKDGFTQTPDRTCGKRFQENCTADSDCHPHFVCYSYDEKTPKQCVCGEGKYHNGTGTCRIPVFRTCGTEETSGFECTYKASCKKNQCVCETGYKGGYNSICQGLYDSECPVEEGDICKWDDNLICGANRTCICKKRFVGDDQNKKCLGLIDEECNNNDDCVANSVCLPSESSSWHHCGCGDKQVKSQDRNICLSVLGGDCTETPCNDAYFLACSEEGVCKCKNENVQIPDKENSRCVAKADGLCGIGIYKNISCVANSGCLTDGHVCSCDDQFVNDGHGRCAKSGSCTVLVSGSLLAIVAVVMMMI